MASSSRRSQGRWRQIQAQQVHLYTIPAANQPACSGKHIEVETLAPAATALGAHVGERQPHHAQPPACWAT